MRRLGLGVIAVLAVLAVLAAGCGVDTAETAETGEQSLTVVATTTVLADLVEVVAGDRADVRSITGIGVDPHAYQPTPSDARLVADADLVVRNGLGLEGWLAGLLDEAHAAGEVVTLTDGLDPLTQDEGEYAGDPDPHLWMDPVMAVGYVEAARDGLSAVDEAAADEYAANAAAYTEDLAALDEWVADEMASIPEDDRELVTTHDAFRYFGDRYGLEVLGTLWGTSTEREPSADEVRALVDAVRDRGVPAVFVETTVDHRLMRRVATDAGVGLGDPLLGDSLGDEGQASTYLGMVRHNARAIVEGLAGGQR